MECTFAMIKPDAFENAADIISIARENGFSLVAKDVLKLTPERAQRFYEEHKDKPFFPALVEFMTSGKVVVMVLRKTDAINAWRSLIGPTNPEEARKLAQSQTSQPSNTTNSNNNSTIAPAGAPTSQTNGQSSTNGTATPTPTSTSTPSSTPPPVTPIRALYGKDVTHNAVHGSDSRASAEREINFFFPEFDPSIPSGAKVKQYLSGSVVPLVTQAMAELCRNRPADPVEYLGNYLLANNPKKSNHPKIFFVLGGPGSGKGTQCQKIVQDFGFDHICAGDLLRDEVKSGTALGQQIAEMIKQGQIVSPKITLSLVAAKIEASKAPAILLDGYPRKLDQAGAFEKDYSDFEAVFFFDCPEDVLEKRLLSRAETSGRADDNIDTIKKRFKTFVETSMPVIEYYEARGKVEKIDTSGEIEAIYNTLKAALADRGFSMMDAKKRAQLAEEMAKVQAPLAVPGSAAANAPGENVAPASTADTVPPPEAQKNPTPPVTSTDPDAASAPPPTPAQEPSA